MNHPSKNTPVWYLKKYHIKHKIKTRTIVNPNDLSEFIKDLIVFFLYNKLLVSVNLLNNLLMAELVKPNQMNVDQAETGS